jgi:hypothetical protein
MIGLQGPSQIINYDETIPVVRYGETIYLEGKPIQRKLKDFFITCNVQPVDGRDLLLVPEGDRFKEQYWLYTNNLQVPLRDNDRIVRNGINFQTQNVENWGSYQKCRIMRIDVGPYAESP